MTRNRVFLISSGKGGVGKTTATANIGLGLARYGNKVCLIDGDIALKNLDLHFGAEGRCKYSAIDALNGLVDFEKIFITDRRWPNLHIIQLTKIKQKFILNTDDLKNILMELSSRNFDYILIDCPAGIDNGFLLPARLATDAIIVSTLEVPTIRDVDRVTGILEGFKNINTINLLINRVNHEIGEKDVSISVRDMLDLVGIPLLGTIPDDRKVIVSANIGTPIISNLGTVNESPASLAFDNATLRLIDPNKPMINFDSQIESPTKSFQLKNIFLRQFCRKLPVYLASIFLGAGLVFTNRGRVHTSNTNQLQYIVSSVSNNNLDYGGRSQVVRQKIVTLSDAGSTPVDHHKGTVVAGVDSQSLNGKDPVEDKPMFKKVTVYIKDDKTYMYLLNSDTKENIIIPSSDVKFFDAADYFLEKKTIPWKNNDVNCNFVLDKEAFVVVEKELILVDKYINQDTKDNPLRAIIVYPSEFNSDERMNRKFCFEIEKPKKVNHAVHDKEPIVEGFTGELPGLQGFFYSFVSTTDENGNYAVRDFTVGGKGHNMQMKPSSKFAINSVNTINKIMEQNLDKESSNSEPTSIYLKRLKYPRRNPFKSGKEYSDSYSGRFGEIEIENEKSDFSLNQVRRIKSYRSYTSNNINGKQYDNWISKTDLGDAGKLSDGDRLKILPALTEEKNKITLFKSTLTVVDKIFDTNLEETLPKKLSNIKFRRPRFGKKSKPILSSPLRIKRSNPSESSESSESLKTSKRSKKSRASKSYRNK